jgi:DNA-binding NtrC family response regulator
VTATNRNLEDQVSKGEFREDLYYRLNVIAIHIPPLRERKEDIPPLAGHFLSLYASRFHKQVVGFSDEVMELFMNYDWPGNIRELGNLIQRSVLLCEEDTIQPKDVEGYLSYKPSPTRVEYPDLLPEGMNLEAKLEEFEKFYITKALEKTGGHLTQAAKLLSMSFRGLRYKIKKYKML